MDPSIRQFKSVAVFCGAAPGNSPVFMDAAKTLGQVIAKRGMTLVYGGGTVDGGHVVGVIPTALRIKEVVGRVIGEMIEVNSMHERKVIMYKRSDCVIILPGGLGTMDELFEVATWSQLGIHTKPIGILNINGYYDYLLAWVRNAVDNGFISKENAAILNVGTTPEELLDTLATVPVRESKFNWENTV